MIQNWGKKSIFMGPKVRELMSESNFGDKLNTGFTYLS